MSPRKVVTDVAVASVTRGLIRLRGLVFIPLITLNLGIGAFGAYAQVLAVVNLLELVFGLGLYDALVRYGRRTGPEDIYYSLLLVTGVSTGAVAGVIVLFAPWIASVTLGSSEYAMAFRVGATLILIRAVFRLAWNYFRIDSRIKLFSAVEAARAYGIVGVVVISVVVLKTGLVGLFTAMVLWESFVFLAIQVQIVREIGVNAPGFRNLRTYLDFSVPIALASLASNSSSRADRILIGAFLGASAVGIYSIAYQIASTISMYTTPIQQTFFPEFSDLIDEGMIDRCETYLRLGVRYFLIIALPTVAGIYLIGPDVVSILTNGQGVPSMHVMAIVALGITVQGVDGLYGVVIKAVEETDWRAKVIGAGAVLNVLVNLVAIPTLGILGAALATLLTYVFVLLLTVRRVEHLLAVTIPWLTVVRCSGATLLMLAAAHFVLDLGLVFSVVVSPPLYFGLLFLSRELTVSELRTRFYPN